MGWARFDDTYTDNPKIRAAGPWAELLDMRAIIYCARYDTDGRLTPSGLQTIRHGIARPVEKVERLIAVGRWSIDPSGGWQVIGFLEHNLSKAARDDIRRGGRERQARYRASRNGVSDTTLGRGGELQTPTRARTIARCGTCGALEIDCTCNKARGRPKGRSS
ncbi:MAG TPA: hypothetical protein VKB59_19455 [Micromonosporaceae bacterium]|nr:hypothetical protein [Micromonosporaceae bacterium]